jgi:hypothetical protein
VAGGGRSPAGGPGPAGRGRRGLLGAEAAAGSAAAAHQRLRPRRALALAQQLWPGPGRRGEAPHPLQCAPPPLPPPASPNSNRHHHCLLTLTTSSMWLAPCRGHAGKTSGHCRLPPICLRVLVGLQQLPMADRRCGAVRAHAAMLGGQPLQPTHALFRHRRHRSAPPPPPSSSPAAGTEGAPFLTVRACVSDC